LTLAPPPAPPAPPPLLPGTVNSMAAVPGLVIAAPPVVAGLPMTSPGAMT